jgi:hypothetical protein
MDWWDLVGFGRIGRGGIPIGVPFPLWTPLDPQHPQHIGKYGIELSSDPQQSRNKVRHRGATFQSLTSKVEDLT